MEWLSNAEVRDEAPFRLRERGSPGGGNGLPIHEPCEREGVKSCEKH
jgi:hypothetical protein